jgi:hypothetical protein
MRTFAATMLSLLLVACVTTRQAALPAHGYGIEGVNSGDTVVVHLLNGDQQRFEVSYVDEIGIHGLNQTYAYTDIRSVDVVEKKNHSVTLLTTVLLIGLLAATYALDPVSYTGPFCVYSSNDPNPKC